MPNNVFFIDVTFLRDRKTTTATTTVDDWCFTLLVIRSRRRSRPPKSATIFAKLRARTPGSRSPLRETDNVPASWGRACEPTPYTVVRPFIGQYRGLRIVVPILVFDPCRFPIVVSILVPIIFDRQRSGRGSGHRFRSTKIETKIKTKRRRKRQPNR